MLAKYRNEIEKLYLGGHALTPPCDVGEDKSSAVSLQAKISEY